MPKKIIRYKLEGDGSVPKWVEDGGVFKLGNEYIGLSVDDDIYFVPSEVQEIQEPSLKARIKSVYRKLDGGALSDAEVDQVLSEWKSQVGHG